MSSKGRDAARARRVAASSDRCHWCGTEISVLLPRGHPQRATCDHLLPLSRGGADAGPAVPACHKCNSRRGNRHPSVLRTTLLPDF